MIDKEGWDMKSGSGDYLHFLVPLLHQNKTKQTFSIPEIRQRIISIPLTSSNSKASVILGRIELIQAIIRSCSRIRETKECHECTFLRKNAKYLQRQMFRFQCFESQERNTTFVPSIKMCILYDDYLHLSSHKQEFSRRSLIRINDESVCDILHRTYQDKVASPTFIPQDTSISIKNGDIITIFIPTLSDDCNSIHQSALSEYPRIQFRVSMDAFPGSNYQRSTLSQDREKPPRLSAHHFSQVQNFHYPRVNGILNGDFSAQLLVSSSQNLHKYNNYDDNLTMIMNSYLCDSTHTCDDLFVSKDPLSPQLTLPSKSAKKTSRSLMLDCGISQLIYLRDSINISSIRRSKSITSQRRMKLRQTLLNLSIMRHSEPDGLKENRRDPSHILSISVVYECAPGFNQWYM